MKCANKIGFSSFYDERSLTNFPKRDYDVEECLKTLEEWIVALLEKAESHSNVSKLRYCYWCVNTMRAGLNKSGLMEHATVSNSVIIMSEHLQNVLSTDGHLKYTIDSLSTMDWVHGRRVLSPISRKCSASKRKLRRKCRSHKRSKENESVKKTFASSKQYQLDLQYLIDQLYIQARTVLAENCFDNVHILKELGSYIDKTMTKKDGFDSRPILPTNDLNENCQKYPSQHWFANCKINGDSRDSFSDTFETILESSNADLDLGAFNDRLFQRYKKSSVGSHRSRIKRDSDFDEGFSENEFVDEVGSSLIFDKTSKSVSKECLRYCGDCDYNSSNSKLYEGLQGDLTEIHDTGSLDVVSQHDDGSDSDGGTEILNSVNATVNKFNAIMQHNLVDVVNGHIDIKNPSVFNDDINYTYNQWTNGHTADHLHSSNNQQEHTVSGTSKLPLLPLINGSSTYNDERIDSPTTNILSQIHCPTVYQHGHQMSSMANVSCVSGDVLSKMMVSPISIPNWCSFNCNYIQARSFNYYSKQNKNCDSVNTSSDNYDIQKRSPWLPCISNSVPSSNSYHIQSNHRQQQQHQQLHQILLSPQLSLPSMQHNIVHLPQIFQQSHQQSTFDTDYLDRRFNSLNPKLFSGPNNHHSGNDSFVSPAAITVVTNSNNHSNISVSKNHICQSIFKASLDKSQRACCFYMRGGCKKEDCEYAHDLSKVTCKFWEKGDCFKSDTCPFKHGYHKE